MIRLSGERTVLSMKIGGHHGARLEHRLVDRVAVEDAGRGPRVPAAPLAGVQNGEVARHAALPAGHAGQDTLPAAAETGKIVKTDGAGQNDPVRLRHRSG